MPTAEDPELQDVIQRELRLQDPAIRHEPETAAELLDPEFYEFGASGRVWDRTSVLAMMAGDDAPPPVVDRIVTTRLAEDVVLLTYRAWRPEHTALRSSLWRRRDGGPWRVFFHQGTVQPRDVSANAADHTSERGAIEQVRPEQDRGNA